jgi:hypothetical protein
VRLPYHELAGLDASSIAFQKVVELDSKRSTPSHRRKRTRADAWEDTAVQEQGMSINIYIPANEY